MQTRSINESNPEPPPDSPRPSTARSGVTSGVTSGVGAAITLRAPVGPVPDWCNLGILLRVSVSVNVLLFAFAGTRAGTLVQWATEIVNLAVLVEPVLLASLFAGCVLRRLSLRLPAALQIALALFVPASLTWMLEIRLEGLLEFGAGHPLRNALFAALICAVVLYWHHLRESARSPALAEAQLQALQARIRPHFLFNSLNAVLGLIRSDPRRAEVALEDLADLFRVLMRDGRERIPLAREVELCRQYLAIESLRLGERLRVEWSVGARTGDALVPALLLQPLVENAVHHGIEPSADAGCVTIDIARVGNTIEITIANPWLGDAAAERARWPGRARKGGNHMALDNVRQRLALLHDLEARVDTTVRDGRFVVKVTLPAQAG